MGSNGEAGHGYVLLLAAAPAGKGRLIDAGSVVTPASAIPPAAWTGTTAATLAELADPIDPHAVVTRIRAAAAAKGPLTVVLIGQLHQDRRGNAVHLALARTAPGTVRYTGLPWQWLHQELQQRRPGTTTVYLDLIADAEVWEQLQLDGAPPSLGEGTAMFGVIAPPPGRRRIAQPRYAQGLVRTLRSGLRPSPAGLHQAALAETDVAGAIVLPGDLAPTATAPAAIAASPAASPATPAPAPPARAVSPHYVPNHRVVPVEQDPHPRIAAASKAGRHAEAAELAAAAEQQALAAYGPGTHVAVHWREVRAFIAEVAQDAGSACELWLDAARQRLDALNQDLDDKDVQNAIDHGHEQWQHIRDVARARELAPLLAELRHRAPSRHAHALPLLYRRLEKLGLASLIPAPPAGPPVR
jgi:hypothetical protein